MPLQLTHTPGEWDGTFTVLARQFARDLLLDGPILIQVNGVKHILQGYDAAADCLVFGGNVTMDMTGVDEIAVA